MYYYPILYEVVLILFPWDPAKLYPSTMLCLGIWQPQLSIRLWSVGLEGRIGLPGLDKKGDAIGDSQGWRDSVSWVPAGDWKG